jgi:two-component system NarL family response regulator
MASPVIRLLIADDHFVVRLGLSSALRRERDFEVVAEAEDGEEAVALYLKHRPDVTLIDSRMPVLGGVAAVKRIILADPAARFVMLTVHDAEEDIHRAVTAGVKAFLAKDADASELADAIRAVHQGGTYFPARIVERLENRQARPELSAREVEVLEELARGRTNKEIAAALGIAPATVKIHVARILEKLGALDRTQAVSLALSRGLLAPAA